MGDYFVLTDAQRNNLLLILHDHQVTGADAHKVVAINEILTSKSEKKLNNNSYTYYVKINDDLVNYIKTMLDGVVVKGSFALQIVQLQMAFRARCDMKSDNLITEESKAGPPAPNSI